MQWFEEFCAPICNFRAARYKFSKVYQKQGETIDTFYNRILKISNQCEFSDPDECLIDAIIFGTSIIKAQDKLLQTPKTLNLQQCLTVCHHYESLKLHIKQIRPNKIRWIIYINITIRKKGKVARVASLVSLDNREVQVNRSQNNMQKSGQSQSYQSQSMSPVQQKCFKCGLTRGTRTMSVQQ